MADALGRALRKVIVYRQDGDGAGWGRQHLRAFQKAASEVAHDIVAANIHIEVASIFQLLVYASAEQRDIAHAPLHHDGHRGSDHRRRVGRGNDVTLSTSISFV